MTFPKRMILDRFCDNLSKTQDFIDNFGIPLMGITQLSFACQRLTKLKWPLWTETVWMLGTDVTSILPHE